MTMADRQSPDAMPPDPLARWDNEGGAIPKVMEMDRSLRIVIAEDEPRIALQLSTQLHAMGHEICAIVRTTGQAITAAHSLHPDLIIMDAHLPCIPAFIGTAPILRALLVPRLFNDGIPLPRPLLPPDAVVIRKPFRATHLARAIRQAMDKAA
ncbi:hypothetical protein [Niveispirillum sp. KHB5.9]|uniref:hypothetical protein n=1 Tax=Niveispirillum sp. KHB5.9 TaxID=3400269 RepID=UPI003A853E8D